MLAIGNENALVLSTSAINFSSSASGGDAHLLPWCVGVFCFPSNDGPPSCSPDVGANWSSVDGLLSAWLNDGVPQAFFTCKNQKQQREI